MRYKLLGKSGLRVSELSLGTMSFGEDWGWGASKEESRKIFDAYAEAGGNFIDTANLYTNGTSEKYLGDMIQEDREHFVLATKYTLSTRMDDPNASGNHRKNLVQAVENSLKRLKTDYIDLLWVHAWDFLTPEQEVMRALDDLISRGKVLYVGVSDTPAWMVSRSNTLAELQGWNPFVALQLRYSLIDRTAERELLPMAYHMDMGVLLWSVLGAGVLTGKYNSDNPPKEGRAKKGAASKQRNLDIAEEVIAVAKEVGARPSQVAIRWAMDQPGVMIPLIGANNLDQFKDNLGALDVKLDDNHMDRLYRVSGLDEGFPNNFLKKDAVRKNLYSNTYDKVDRHRENPMDQYGKHFEL